LAYGQHVGFVMDKAALGQVFSEYFGWPCQSFHRYLHYHNHPGLTQLAIKWSQCQVDRDSTPHYANFNFNFSRRLLTVAARVRSQVKSCGICGEQSDTGHEFAQVLRFPLPILIPPNDSYPPDIPVAGIIARIVADVTNGLTPNNERKKNISA
jgi:hypothetical protein